MHTLELVPSSRTQPSDKIGDCRERFRWRVTVRDVADADVEHIDADFERFVIQAKSGEGNVITRLIGIQYDGLPQQRDGLRGVACGFVGVGSEAQRVGIGMVAGDQGRENFDGRLVLSRISKGDGDVIKAAALETKLAGREALWALVQSGRHPAATIFWARTHCGLAKPQEQQTKSSSSAKTYYHGVPPPVLRILV